ncbi:uncharacterized protein LOC128984563 [Macrosteles quadrilineatus]|uniref:uncharacterized protein LOC128984563 n=1 Tax=Macrosteles quadrilineatus TaxID=74068 RepID=UPI0023E24FA8|nr:uncharacterized protein LOC128984563 [Macrosteles quadrilineatus]
MAQSFHDFAKNWNFKIVLSSPYHHQANGKTESAVKVFKNLLKKSRQDGVDFQQALLELRNTPLQGICFSPTQLLMNRRTQSKLSINKSLLKPQVPQNVQNLWERKKRQYKSQYDHGTTELPPLSIGQSVLLKKQPQLKNATWLEGKVVQKEGRRKYIVRLEGKDYIRNRQFLRT